jgi:hypothetical protein
VFTILFLTINLFNAYSKLRYSLFQRFILLKKCFKLATDNQIYIACGAGACLLLFVVSFSLFLLFICSQAREYEWGVCYSKEQKKKRDANNMNLNVPITKPVGYFSISDSQSTQIPYIPGVNFKSSNDSTTAKTNSRSNNYLKSAIKEKPFASASLISMISQVSIDDNLGIIDKASKSAKKLKN